MKYLFIFLAYEVLCLFLHVVRRRQNCAQILWCGQLEKMTKLTWTLGPSGASKVWKSSKSDEVFCVMLELLCLVIYTKFDDLFSFWRGVFFFWSNVLTSGWPFFKSSTKVFELLLCFWCFNTCSKLDGYIIWSCTLEQILVCLIVLQYSVIIITLEELYKILLVPIISPFLMMINTSIWNNCC
jgi:hypothetical protein